MPDDSSRERQVRKRFFVACAIGALVAGAVFGAVLVEGHPERFFDKVELANVYEAQARSLTELRWDIPERDLSSEAFFVDGKAYTYFGPWPAVLRVPVVAVTDSLDGRLGPLSMLAAFAIAMVFAARLAWRGRTLVRGAVPIGRTELFVTGVVFATVGAGSPMVFLASVPWVFHEAILWAIALALAGFSFLVTFLLAGDRRALLFAAIAGTLGALSRPTVGLGPLIAIAVVLLAVLLGRARDAWQSRSDASGAGPASRDPEGTPRTWPRWLGLGGLSTRGWITPLALSIATPVVLYAYVNYSRFRSLFGYEIDRQLLLSQDPARKAALAANGGNLTGIKFSPTTLLAYWRPDGISLDRLFPWFTFPKPPRVFGDVVFDTLDAVASIPATTILLLLLTAFGIAALVATRRLVGSESRVGVFRVPLITAGLTAAMVLPFGYVAQRYEADIVPFLVLGAVVGLPLLARLGARHSRGARGVAVTVVVALAAWSIAANTGVAIQYQRLYRPALTMETRRGFVETQLDIHDVIPGGTVSNVRQGPVLPDVPAAGELFIVGECDGLYWSDGKAWRPIVETPATGRHRLRVRLPDVRPGTIEPLLASATAESSSVLGLRTLRGDRIRFEYVYAGQKLVDESSSRALRIDPDRPLDLDLRFDSVDPLVEVRIDGERVFVATPPVTPGPVTVGEATIAGRPSETFSGTIRPLAIDTEVCDRLVESRAAAQQAFGSSSWRNRSAVRVYR